MMKPPTNEFTVFVRQQVAGTFMQLGSLIKSTGYPHTLYDPLRDSNWAIILTQHGVGTRAADKITEECL